jgi:ABC-type nitrate/sulfonate/bicarbonate transport system ATPase subunit
LDTPDSGDVSVGGKRVDGPGLDRGIVFQDHRLMPWLTAEENVAAALIARGVPRDERHQAARRMLALVGLEGFEGAYPSQLSGGMAQRAAIGRALANDPDILLLDEPLGALDAFTRLKLQNAIVRLSEDSKKTILLVTHDIEEAVFFADRIVIMDARPGRVRHIIPVDLPRPRDRSSAAFVALRERVLSEFASETH